MTDQWPVCKECGQRHPKREEIISALLSNAFEEEPAQATSLNPEEMGTIVRAIEKLAIKEPALWNRTEAYINSISNQIETSGVDLSSENVEITFQVTTSDYALMVVALEDLAADDPEYGDNVLTIQSKLSRTG